MSEAVDDGASGAAPGPVEVKLRRGVTRYVNAHSGRLYLWAKPFGRGDFAWAHASTEPPAGLEFARSPAVSEFAFFVERGMKPWSLVKLSRRWWGLREGIVVDTGDWWGGGNG